MFFPTNVNQDPAKTFWAKRMCMLILSIFLLFAGISRFLDSQFHGCQLWLATPGPGPDPEPGPDIILYLNHISLFEIGPYGSIWAHTKIRRSHMAQDPC